MTPACNVEVALWIYQVELGTLWSPILCILTSGGFLCDTNASLVRRATVILGISVRIQKEPRRGVNLRMGSRRSSLEPTPPTTGRWLDL